MFPLLAPRQPYLMRTSLIRYAGYTWDLVFARIILCSITVSCKTYGRHPTLGSHSPYSPSSDPPRSIPGPLSSSPGEFEAVAAVRMWLSAVAVGSSARSAATRSPSACPPTASHPLDLSFFHFFKIFWCKSFYKKFPIFFIFECKFFFSITF